MRLAWPELLTRLESNPLTASNLLPRLKLPSCASPIRSLIPSPSMYIPTTKPTPKARQPANQPASSPGFTRKFFPRARSTPRNISPIKCIAVYIITLIQVHIPTRIRSGASSMCFRHSLFVKPIISNSEFSFSACHLSHQTDHPRVVHTTSHESLWK